LPSSGPSVRIPVARTSLQDRPEIQEARGNTDRLSDSLPSIRAMKMNPLKKTIRLVGKAIGDFNLVEQGDRVLVALSGGKDSWSLLYALRDLQRKAPVSFDLMAVTLHPGSEGFVCGQLDERLTQDEIPHEVVHGDLVSIINDHLTDGTNPCSFCSRLRRGILYSFAARKGWNKIALGHHLDDFIETLLLNMFFNSTIKAMSPMLKADDGVNTIIRPLVYVPEALTRETARDLVVPIVGCLCSYQGMSGTKRQWVKGLIETIEKDVPNVRTNILAAMGRVQPRHLLEESRVSQGTQIQSVTRSDAG